MNWMKLCSHSTSTKDLHNSCFDRETNTSHDKDRVQKLVWSFFQRTYERSNGWTNEHIKTYPTALVSENTDRKCWTDHNSEPPWTWSVIFKAGRNRYSIVYPRATERRWTWSSTTKLHIQVWQLVCLWIRFGNLSACECLSNGLKCTQEYKLQDCTNSTDATHDEEEQTSDKDEDDEYDDWKETAYILRWL